MRRASEDIQRRRPVWEALSELFLDTELQETHLRQVADVLVASGYSDDELERILLDEVYPICIWNRRSMVGVWNGFDPDWLEGQILRREKGSWRKWWPFRSGRWMIQSDWRRVIAYVQGSRDLIGPGGAGPERS